MTPKPSLPKPSIPKPSIRETAQDAATKSFLAGVERERADDRDGAIAFYRQALDRYPAFPDACRNLAGLLAAKGERAAAIAWLRRALSYAPEVAMLYARLADQLRMVFAFDEAAALLRRALELEPNSVEAWFDLGLWHADRAADREAIVCFERAIELAEPAHPLHLASRWHRGIAYLTLGDLPRGFAECEVRYRVAGRWREFPTPKGPMPVWQGEKLAGKRVLVWTDQGFGDTLQFVRFLPGLAAHGAQPILSAPPELVPLLRGIQGLGEIVASDAPPPQADFHVPLMSLPFRLGTTLETLPPATPYMTTPYIWAPHAPTPPLIERPPGTRLAVGIVWAGAPSHPQDYKRSARLEPFLALGDIPGVELYSLQKGPQSADLAAAGAEGLVRDLGARLKHFGDTAAALAELDLLVGVDSAAIHLAGVLGRPALVLLPYASDWRWMRGRADSPWYPSLRLCRQAAPGDWPSAIAEARARIAELARVPAR